METTINKDFIENLMTMVLSNDAEDASLAENILGNILKDDDEKIAFTTELDNYWNNDAVDIGSNLKTYPAYLKLCLLHTAMEMKIKNNKMDPELSERLQDENFYDNILQNVVNTNIK
jgi:ParB-like chromosome segregation protein Spo0J